VDQRGGTNYPAPNENWAGEISLDVDMVSAAAPAAHILLVEADDNSFVNLAAAVDQAVAMGAKYVSNSYGTSYTSVSGSGEDASEVTDLDPHYNHPGVAVVASSGDDDFGVSYPAASQYVTSVGGTALLPDSSPRGWSETVWHNSFGGPGSGCSVFEAKPAWQTDSGCSMRSVADVSAVSDPVTGVAVYQTFGNNGWAVYGGTSAASPIIASVYAAAGTPVSGTYPSSYLYAGGASAFHDVTVGTNGTCTPTYLCTAAPGFDGPTGLGTPNGLAGFRTGPHGQVTGTVTDAGTGSPIAGASITAGDASALSDAAGHYTMSVPIGTYDITYAAFGYASKTITGVAVAENATVTENVALSAVARSTISGVVTDASGHGWPLYARITVDGIPGGPVFTDPATGHYSLSLPQGQTYTLHITAAYPGYQAVTQNVTLGTSAVNANVSVPVDSVACNAPGYTVHFNGTTEAFNATTAPPGWTVTNAAGTTGGWQFTDDGARGNLTGGTGGFAIVDSDHLGSGNHQDTVLTTPAADFTSVSNPSISFDTDYRAFSGQSADVDVSVDGGATWSNIWEFTTTSFRGPAHVDLPVPTAANKAGVLFRFHFISSFGWWWELDNVFVGSRSCDPISGGLVVGEVKDANTGNGITGATVTTADAPGVSATTAATPEDPNLSDGFYWLFSPVVGSHPFTAAKSKYTSVTAAVNVQENYTVRKNFTLKAGQITVTPTSISKTVPWAGTATANITVKNTGTAPATVNVGEQPGGSTPLLTGGAPLHQVNGKFSSHSLKGQGKATGKAPVNAEPADAPWTAIANYPTAIQDNVAAVYNGKLYSAFGYTGSNDVSSLYVYDPESGSWSPLASAADTREKPAAAFINGKFYAVGGWGASGDPDAKLEIYDPASNSWSTGAASPKPYAGSGTAVLNGKLYVIGGCTGSACGVADVEVYDPASNSWSAAASYPEAIAWQSCGTIGTKIYCAGGTTDAGSVVRGYAYDASGNSWTPIASMPADLWGSASTAASGLLLISGGVTGNGASITNKGYAYNPQNDAWTALPNANQTLYRSGSACGLYRVGGSPGGLSAPPVNAAEVLPGFTDCDAVADVSWLSLSPTTLTLQPGKSAKIVVTLNADVPDITQPGTYTASITVATDTPYPVASVGVSMTVNPPKTWGKIAGHVTSAVDGSPIAGATIQIDTWAASYTLKTDKNGYYQLWLDVRNNPLQVICAKDGFQPQVKKVKITKGGTTTTDFVLKKA
jgi:N-acetylneuraminic acid mutarotase